MSADWEMVVRVRVRNCMKHTETNAERDLREAIADEGGAFQVIAGWCDPDDVEIVSLKPWVVT